MLILYTPDCYAEVRAYGMWSSGVLARREGSVYVMLWLLMAYSYKYKAIAN